MDILSYQEVPETPVLEGIMELHRHVFEGAQLSLEELQEKEKLLLLIAKDCDRVIGFKIGYQYAEDTFYSWLGGVHADYRGKGVATQLMERQHGMVRGLGYAKIRTISRNKRREMLLLNIKFGFDVVETFISKKGTHKILLEKELKK